jgi:hypothetical protein
MECSKGQEPWINLLIRLPSRGTVIVSYTDKKEKQIFLIYIRKFRINRLHSNIRLTASS